MSPRCPHEKIDRNNVIRQNALLTKIRGASFFDMSKPQLFPQSLFLQKPDIDVFRLRGIFFRSFFSGEEGEFRFRRRKSNFVRKSPGSNLGKSPKAIDE